MIFAQNKIPYEAVMNIPLFINCHYRSGLRFASVTSEKAHENRLTVIRDTAEQEMTTLRQTNLRRLQELNAEIQRFEIEMREMEEVS